MARFLVVDDEPLIAMLAQDWLEELGHQTLGPAHDLPTALRLAQEPVDAALLDVSLGADKSFDVARRLQAAGVPFAFATGHAPDPFLDEFADSLTLAKPFSFESFSGVVAELARRSASSAAKSV
jgi:CheY-like chemotaxis protein